MARTIERSAFGPAPVPELLTGTAFMAEAGADTFVIRDLPFTPAAWEDEDEQEHAGVLAHVLRADDVAIAVDGSLDETGAAVVTLPADCYHVPGRLSVAIYISDSAANVACVYACVGNVYRTVGGTELDSGTEVPDLTALQAAYNAAMGAVAEVDEALENLPDAVLYEAQTLTDAQQAQARKNISVPAETAELLAMPATSGYLVTSGDTVDVTDVQSGTGYFYAVESCAPGDKFTVRGSVPRSGSGYLVFIDESGNKLHSEQGHASSFAIVTAPAGTNRVIRQYRTSGTSAGNIWYSGATISARLDALEAAVAALQPAGLLAAAPGGDDA